MNHGNLSTCERLTAALKVLQDAKGKVSTLELCTRARVCAANSVVAELRANGAEITCHREQVDGKPVFYYTLIKSPEVQTS